VHEALDARWHVAEDVTAKQVLTSTGVRTEQLLMTGDCEERGKIAPEAQIVPPSSTAPPPAPPTAPAAPNGLRPEGGTIAVEVHFVLLASMAPPLAPPTAPVAPQLPQALEAVVPQAATAVPHGHITRESERAAWPRYQSDAAKSGDGIVTNVGVKMTGDFTCPDCHQRFDTEKAKDLHWKFFHDPNRHQED